MTIFWFRRDLRINDNKGLYHALTSNDNVLPIFIFDTTILSQLEKDDARVTFIHQELEKINKKLKGYGNGLATFNGDPIKVFQKLIKNHKISAVYTNHDYEPYARKRDLEIYQLLNTHKISFYTSKDQVIFEKNEIVKEDGNPYVVYTPYSKKWKTMFQLKKTVFYPSENFLSNTLLHSYPFLQLPDIGFEKSKIVPTTANLSKKHLDSYKDTRNFPSLEGTSNIGIYLRFGSLSIREAVMKALELKDETFLNELIWREFFMQILWHFPQTVKQSFKPKYDEIKWENNEVKFKKWCEGKTGFPLVDAGMRELNTTGTMHNRVRMVVASFLCKDLLIDWRWGETYFAQKLLDYEQSSNIGNWQWAAGSGVDAAPYFRIFNPEEQLKKFDKNREYISKWIPELNTPNYPDPIVNHKEAREACLKMYKTALQ